MSYHLRYPNHYHYQHHLPYQSPSSSIIVHVATNAKKAYEADYWEGFLGWGNGGVMIGDDGADDDGADGGGDDDG